MSREFPDWINPWKAAEGKRIFSGTIALAKLERLSPLLANAEGEAAFSARFGQDRQGQVMVHLEVDAELPLVCQVSLEEYRHEVSRRSSLAVVRNEEEQYLLPDDYEATCAEEGRLGFSDLVEDELLLALPQVPRKPGLEQAHDDAGQKRGVGDETYRPFARLEDLMRGGRTKQD
jgi:uncharacterized protein